MGAEGNRFPQNLGAEVNVPVLGCSSLWFAATWKIGMYVGNQDAPVLLFEVFIVWMECIVATGMTQVLLGRCRFGEKWAMIAFAGRNTLADRTGVSAPVICIPMRFVLFPVCIMWCVSCH